MSDYSQCRHTGQAASFLRGLGLAPWHREAWIPKHGVSQAGTWDLKRANAALKMFLKQGAKGTNIKEKTEFTALKLGLPSTRPHGAKRQIPW